MTSPSKRLEHCRALGVELIDSLDELFAQLGPDYGENSRQLTFPGLESWDDVNRAQVEDSMRSLVEDVVHAVFKSNARLNKALLAALALPRGLDGENIRILPNRRLQFSERVLSQSVHALDMQQIAPSLPPKLEAAGIRSLADLIAPHGMARCAELGLSITEFDALDSVATRYGFRLPPAVKPGPRPSTPTARPTAQAL